MTDCNFTYDHYIDTLLHAKAQGYPILPLSPRHCKQEGKIILLRHDVDMSMSEAAKLARIEHKHGIQSTYFIHLHSAYYNALSPESLRTMTELIALGHEIGLHYDSIFGASVIEESQILQILLGKRVEMISQHDPGTGTVMPYPDLDDAKDVDATYLSDSVQFWRRGCMCKNLDRYERMQILTHPIWWSETGASRSLQLERLRMDMEQKILAQVKATNARHSDYIRNLKITA